MGNSAMKAVGCLNLNEHHIFILFCIFFFQVITFFLKESYGTVSIELSKHIDMQLHTVTLQLVHFSL